MTRLYKREDEVFSEAKATLETLSALMMRVKTYSVKDGVKKLVGLFEALAKSRSEIKAECRAVVAGERTRADTMAGDSKACDRVEASESKILDALNEVSRRLDSHDAILTNLKGVFNNV